MRVFLEKMLNFADTKRNLHLIDKCDFVLIIKNL